MKITENDVRYVADLANLDLTDAERAGMQKDLNAILDYIEQLSELDTANVEPMAQVAQIAGSSSAPEGSLRTDQLRECLPHESAMANAPLSDGTFFRVPKVIER